MTEAVHTTHQSGESRIAPSRRLRRSEAIAGYALAAPGFGLMLALVLLPAVSVIFIALTDWQLGASTLEFVGFRNFSAMVSDPVFRTSLLNTLAYVLVVVPVTLALGLFVAILIEANGRFRAFYRAIHFLPVMATLAAMAIAWEALLHPTIGLFNRLLESVGFSGPNWLRNPSLVLPTLMMIGVWQHLGFAMVLFLAGLKAVPMDLYDAAAIDGADGAIDRFTTVTLPMLGPVAMFLIIIISVRALQTFDIVVILTQGGPGHASELLLHTLYVESFEFFRTGYGAAMTVVFLLFVVALTLLQARLLDRRVHYS